MTTSFNPAFPDATRIIGKWKNNKYQIHRLLGEGCNGRVYLVERDRRFFALKIGFNTIDLQHEINVLQYLKQVRGHAIFIENDDFIHQGTVFPYYVMNYFQGRSIHRFVQQHGIEWLYPIGSGLLRKLGELHARGLAFGDVKSDNVIVSKVGEVQLVDYGGVTPFGRAVKQFTEVFDRGYWHAGSRSADASYDIFSMAILILLLADPQQRISAIAQLIPQNRNPDYLLEIIETTPFCQKIKPFMVKAIQGQYGSTSEAETEWRQCVLDTAVNQHVLGAEKKNWLKVLFVVSTGLLSLAIYLTLAAA